MFDESFKVGLKSLYRRRQDDTGVKNISIHSGRLVFGHTRPSIIDLSYGGHVVN